MSEFFKIKYIHLCNYASVDSNGNINALGIFDQIHAKKYPTGLAKMSLVISLQPILDIEKEYELKLIIIDPKGKKSDPSITKIQYPGNGRNLNIITDIANPVFQMPGVYKIKIYIEDEELGGISFEAKENEK